MLLKVIQSRSWAGFQCALAHIPAVGWMVATPPDLLISTLEAANLEGIDAYCIQTNIRAPHETFAIAQQYGGRLLCGTYLLNLETTAIVRVDLVEEDGYTPTTYLLR